MTDHAARGAEDPSATVGLTPGAAPPRAPAYSEHRVTARRAVSATVLRVAAAVLIFGLAVLFTLPPS